MLNIRDFSSFAPNVYSKDGPRAGAFVSVRLCMRQSVNTSSMNISETSRSIGIKFYRKHHWIWEKAASLLQVTRTNIKKVGRVPISARSHR